MNTGSCMAISSIYAKAHAAGATFIGYPGRHLGFDDSSVPTWTLRSTGAAVDGCDVNYWYSLTPDPRSESTPRYEYMAGDDPACGSNDAFSTFVTADVTDARPDNVVATADGKGNIRCVSINCYSYTGEFVLYIDDVTFNAGTVIFGCMDTQASNYDATATLDDGLCELLGCTDSGAENYDTLATTDDGSCTYSDCNDPAYCAYTPEATGTGACNYLCTEVTPTVMAVANEADAAKFAGKNLVGGRKVKGQKVRHELHVTYTLMDCGGDDIIEVKTAHVDGELKKWKGSKNGAPAPSVALFQTDEAAAVDAPPASSRGRTRPLSARGYGKFGADGTGLFWVGKGVRKAYGDADACTTSLVFKVHRTQWALVKSATLILKYRPVPPAPYHALDFGTAALDDASAMYAPELSLYAPSGTVKTVVEEHYPGDDGACMLAWGGNADDTYIVSGTEVVIPAGAEYSFDYYCGEWDNVGDLDTGNRRAVGAVEPPGSCEATFFSDVGCTADITELYVNIQGSSNTEDTVAGTNASGQDVNCIIFEQNGTPPYAFLIDNFVAGYGPE